MKLTCVVTSGCRLASAAACFLLSSAQADTPAFVFGSAWSNPPSSFTGTRGWSFFISAPTGGVAITQLGVFDSGADGLANVHAVGLWKVDGTLLASGTVPAGTDAPLVDGYRYVSITPVTIPKATRVFDPNTAYIIAAQYSAGDADDLLTPSPTGFNPGVHEWTGGLGSVGWYGYGSDLPFPNIRTAPPSEGSLGPGFWEPNFQYTFIPEPAAWRLLAPALFLVLRRRRQAP